MKLKVAQTSTGFGQSAPAATSFGAFGSQPAVAQPAQNGMFGSQSQTSAFGAPQQSQAGMFGKPAVAPGFGFGGVNQLAAAPTSSFQTASTPTTGMFGNVGALSTTTSAFPTFGMPQSQPTTTSLFGQSVPASTGMFQQPAAPKLGGMFGGGVIAPKPAFSFGASTP